MRHKKQIGFTLIEVLIALAIVGIAMTAIIKTTIENIRATEYLQNKTIAMWISEDIQNSIRLGLIHISDDGMHKEKESVLGQSWIWEAKKMHTPNPRINKIIISVFTRDNDQHPLFHSEDYVYIS